MTEPTSTIAPFYKGWDVYQQHLVRAVAPLTAEQLAQGAGPGLRPMGLLATHIVSVRAGWMYYTLLERDERLPGLSAWEAPHVAPKSAGELVSGLEITWEVIDAALHRWTVADLDEIVWDVNDEDERIPYTRQWVLWHLIEHDLHHGGELSLMLGIHGIPAITL